MMAEIYDDSSFELISVREVTDDLPTDERAKVMTQLAEDNKAIRLGYDRLKQKTISQSNYRRETSRKWSIND